MLARLYKWEYFWLAIFVIATLAMHLSIITIPKDLVLDEQHYVKDANYIIDNNSTQRTEHPPLGKLFIVGGIETLGNNQWGWRLPSVLVGMIGLVLFYLICRKLNLSRRAASLATGLYSFENFTFILSSLAMLDVFFVTLMMAFFLLYLNRQYVLSGVFIGLSALAKLYGALAAPTLVVHWLFTRTKHTKWFILTVITAPIAFLGLMPLCDFAITKQWQNPLLRVQEMLGLSASLVFAKTQHDALSRPWEWVLNYKPMAFWYTPHYTGAMNPNIWILIIPVVLYMAYKAVKQRNEAGLFGSAWFLSTYLLWIPASILTDRISFVFYFYPTIGAICLGLGSAIEELLEWLSVKKRKHNKLIWTAIILFFVAHAVSFIILSPVFFRT